MSVATNTAFLMLLSSKNFKKVSLSDTAELEKYGLKPQGKSWEI